MRTLLIDNYDSFTFNLFHLLGEVNGAEPLVVRNDELTWAELEQLEFDNVVISPGPGRPDVAGDFGVCGEIIRRCAKPLLGVCLGHQGIGWIEGGKVERAPEPMHGRVVAIEHDGSALFAGIPSPLRATRYHSLALTRPLPPALREIASCDGIPMALEHRNRPHWGVQFHPESIATQHGKQLLSNFRDLSGAPAAPAQLPTGRKRPFMDRGRPVVGGADLALAVRRIEAMADPEAVFASLYGESENAFWLDSARPGPRGRFSFMGDAGGPLAEVVTYDRDSHEFENSIFDYLKSRTAQLRPRHLPDLPFEFDCGFVGYLGYELKSECGLGEGHLSEHPDAVFLLADRVIAFDHDRDRTYLLCLHQGDEEEAARAWLAQTASHLASSTAAAFRDSGELRRTAVRGGSPGPWSLSRPKEHYLDDIETCRGHLLEGDSYEICLTNQLSCQTDVDPLELYGALRRANPAPFGAYLRLGDLAVLSSSPERFLGIGRDGEAEARPIKGTSRRGASPLEDVAFAAGLAADAKNRAENLIVVDLLRNDLGAVCEVGSIQATQLFEVETYETIHQLVSAVRGRLRPGTAATDAVRACFPPGSMTGAPKLRTTQILDEIEGAARGVYSGALGWFGLGGAADLSVAIRTIVLFRGRATVGAGGAIVADSDPEEEYEEMLLKGSAPLQAVDPQIDLQAKSATVAP